MSRREDSKDSNAVVSVNVDDFTRTRDNVLISLATLQSAVSDLSRAYLNHANTVLNRGPANIDLGGITSSLLENGILGGHGNRPLSPSARSESGDKKKRKRAPPDPNAPKRALTPYFLYMHHNRKKIADEMGTSAKPQEVADEGKRRWNEMEDKEKSFWKELYAENYAIYRERMNAYKAGLPIPQEDWKDPSAQLLQGMQAASPSQEPEEEEEEEEAQEDEREEEDEDDEDEDEDETPEPEREPTPPPRSAKRRRTGDHKPVSTPPTVKRSSPEKKKRSSSALKADREAPATSEKPRRAAAANSEENRSEKKRSKKKRKSETLGSD